MIVVECNADEFLMKCLGFPRSQICHESGKGKVLARVRKKSKVIGVIDEDPYSNQPGEMTEYIEDEVKGTIKLLFHGKDREKKLIQISPYLEGWLIRRAKLNRIDPQNFDLPRDPVALHGIPNIERNPKFHEFLKKLIDADSEIKILQKWIAHTLQSKK